jgi:ABC-type polar amino acid transport system ATPase subunit
VEHSREYRKGREENADDGDVFCRFSISPRPSAATWCCGTSTSRPPGDVTSVIGASGSGKSTLLRCINLLETPTSGQILFHGEDVARRGLNESAYRAKVGMVFQSFNLFSNMTVLENCMAWARPRC